MDLKKTDPDSQYGTGFEKVTKYSIKFLTQINLIWYRILKFIHTKLILRQKTVQIVRYQRYEYTVSNFLHKLVQYGNGFIDEKIKMRYLKLKV